jgi:hypothetical protein
MLLKNNNVIGHIYKSASFDLLYKYITFFNARTWNTHKKISVHARNHPAHRRWLYWAAVSCCLKLGTHLKNLNHHPVELCVLPSVFLWQNNASNCTQLLQLILYVTEFTTLLRLLLIRYWDIPLLQVHFTTRNELSSHVMELCQPNKVRNLIFPDGRLLYLFFFVIVLYK